MTIKYKTRHFNTIKTCEDLIYLKKSSSNKDKIANEFNFLSNIPKEIEKYFPSVKNFSTSKENSAYEIKKIHYPDFGDSIISGLVDAKHISGILNQVEIFFSKLPTLKENEQEFDKKFFELFIQKNEDRFLLTKKMDIFSSLNKIFHSHNYKNFEEFIEILSISIKEEFKKITDRKLYFSHGDLCLSNMFYSPLDKNIILIDPKGYKKDIKETYFPIYYDLAKLSHSFIGLYDFTAHDMYSIEKQKNSYELEIKIKKSLKNLMEKSFKKFLKNMNVSFSLIRLLEATLFTSMIPLHEESQNRSMAHCLNAIKAFNDYQQNR